MNLYQVIEGFVVRMEGLEPPCRKALDPKSSASTNFATSANWNGKGSLFFEKSQCNRQG